VPLYEYQCKKCHSLTERIQKFSDPPLATCPHCGGELEQLLSAPAVQFKGSGWYVTDYAKKSSSKGSSGSNGSASASSENKSETSSSSDKGSSDKSGSSATTSSDKK
jgi:putative FmdB family regulatory protein